MKTVKLTVADIVIEDRIRTTDAAAIADLAESIKSRGLINPITVWRRKADGRHVLAAGEHRIAAHKLLGLDTIEATVLATDHLSDERAGFAATRIEIDENVRRKNLTQLELDLTRDLAVKIEARDQMAAEMEARAAELVKREAEAKRLKAIADAAEAADKAKAVKEAEVSRQRTRDAQEALDRAAARALVVSSGAISTSQVDIATKVSPGVSGAISTSQVDIATKARRPAPVDHSTDYRVRMADAMARARRLPEDQMPKRVEGATKAREAAAAVMATTAINLANAQRRIESIGGHEVAKELRGTQLASQDELAALAILRKEFPKEAEDIIRLSKAHPHVKFSAAGKLGELRKEVKANEHSHMMTAAREDKAKGAAYLVARYQDLEAAILKADNATVDIGMQAEFPEIKKMLAMVFDIGARARNWNTAAKQKVTGTEYKYPVGGGKEATEARAKAKKDQDANNKAPPSKKKVSKPD